MARQAAKSAARSAAKRALLKAALSNPYVVVIGVAVAFIMAIALFTVVLATSTAASAAGACQTSEVALSEGDVPPFVRSRYSELSLAGESRADYMARMRENFGIFAAAAKRYDVQWWLLASVSYVESRIGKTPGESSAGAHGPMQFMPSTWEAYKDASGDPPYDVMDMKDAVFAAAKYLRASGAPDDVQRALFAYNHADWYVRLVLGVARQMRAGADEPSPSSSGARGSQLSYPLPIAAGGRPESVWGESRPAKQERSFEGAELEASSGTSVFSIATGRVSRAGWVDKWGYSVSVRANGVTYVLARLRVRPAVRRGDDVAAGQLLGEVGRTGGSRPGDRLRSTRPHLEVRMYDPHGTLGRPRGASGAIDPTSYLQGAYDGAGADANDYTNAPNCTGEATPGAVEWTQGMTPKDVIDKIVLPVARQNGIKLTPEQVERANAAHGPTVNGGRSDHQGPPEQAWAADISNGSAPTRQMDGVARDLTSFFKIEWNGSGVVNATRHGFRIQLIYRSHVGGNHFNHVHCGIRKL